MTTFKMTLPDGAVMEFRDLSWTPTGRLFCQVVTFAPDGSIIGNTKCEPSSSTSRYKIAQELASHNGARPDIWADALLAAWTQLDQERRDEAEVFDLASLEDEQEPGPLQFVWNPFIPEGFPSNLYGDGGASKSTVVMGLSVAITQGMPFLGHQTMKGPVIYLDWELDKTMFLRRLYAICRGMGLSRPPADLHYVRLTESLEYHLGNIIDACHRIDPVLVALDSLGAAAMKDPNDAEAFIKIVQDLRKLERTALGVDHQSKGAAQSYRTKRAIGTGYKDFLVRGGVQLEAAESVPGRTSLVLRHSKHNFTYEAEPIAFHVNYGIGVINFEVGDITAPSFVDADLLSLPLRVRRVLQETIEPMEAGVLMEVTGASSKQVLQNAIIKLKRKGDKIIGATAQSKTYYSLITGTNHG